MESREATTCYGWSTFEHRLPEHVTALARLIQSVSPPASSPLCKLTTTMITSTSSIPQGGGSLLVAWRLKDKRVLVVGGGEVASGRLESVLAADAQVTLVAPRDGLHPRTKYLIENVSVSVANAAGSASGSGGRATTSAASAATQATGITYHDRVFDRTRDLDGVDMVLTAIDDVQVSKDICTLCRDRKIPINVADVPPSCDFYFGSQIRRGPLQIMVSTNGNSPKLANVIKKRVEESLPAHVEGAIEKVGQLRTRLRKRAPGVGGEVSARRMRWISTICNRWELEDLAKLDDAGIEALLDEGWNRGVVPPSPPRTSASSTQQEADAEWNPGSELMCLAVGCLLGVTAMAAIRAFRRR